MAISLQRLLQAIHVCLESSQAAPDGNQVDKKDAPDKQVRRHHATQILQHGALLISISAAKRAGPLLLTAPPAWTVSARGRSCGVLLRLSFLPRCGVTTRAGTAGAAARSTLRAAPPRDRKSTRLNSSHGYISYAVFCLKKKKTQYNRRHEPGDGLLGTTGPSPHERTATIQV